MKKLLLLLSLFMGLNTIGQTKVNKLRINNAPDGSTTTDKILTIKPSGLVRSIDFSEITNTEPSTPISVSNGIVENTTTGDYELGGTLTKNTFIDMEGSGINLFGLNSFYNFTESFAQISVDGFLNFDSSSSGFNLSGVSSGNIQAEGLNIQSNGGGNLILNTSNGSIQMTPSNGTVSILAPEIILNRFGPNPSIGDVWTSTGTDGKGSWVTPATGFTGDIIVNEVIINVVNGLITGYSIFD